MVLVQKEVVLPCTIVKYLVYENETEGYYIHNYSD
jgi:hypothetical protein